jgi:hypothetical protein
MRLINSYVHLITSVYGIATDIEFIKLGNHVATIQSVHWINREGLRILHYNYVMGTPNYLRTGKFVKSTLHS